MRSHGNRFLDDYRAFLRRFVLGYLLLCAAVFLALIVADLAFPQARIYARLKDLIRAHLPPAGAAPKP